MTSLPVGKNHDARLLLAYHPRDFKTILPGVLDAPVGDVECLPPAHFQDLRSRVGLAGAVFGGAARPQLTLGQIEDAGRMAEARHLEQGSPAGLFHIVAVRGYGKDVDAHFFLSTR